MSDPTNHPSKVGSSVMIGYQPTRSAPTTQITPVTKRQSAYVRNRTEITLRTAFPQLIFMTTPYSKVWTMVRTFQVHTNLCTHFRKSVFLYDHEAPSPETWIPDCVTTGQARLVVEWVNTPGCYPHHRFSLPSTHSLVRISR
jgi:hypothetical protein